MEYAYSIVEICCPQQGVTLPVRSPQPTPSGPNRRLSATLRNRRGNCSRPHHRSRQKKGPEDYLFMDVRGAFDNISRTRLLTTMHQLGIPVQVRNWTCHFLPHRQTPFDGQQEPLQPVQTGSYTSPVLFLLYLRPLFDELNVQQPNCWTPCYCDDVALVVTGSSRAYNARQLEAAVSVAFQWADENAVAFDSSKTELMYFYSTRSNAITDNERGTLPNGTTRRRSQMGGHMARQNAQLPPPRQDQDGRRYENYRSTPTARPAPAQSRQTAIQHLRDSCERLRCRNPVEPPKGIHQQIRDRSELSSPEDTWSVPHDTNISTLNRSGTTTRPRTPQTRTAEIRHRNPYGALEPPHQMALPSLPPTEPLVQLRLQPRRRYGSRCPRATPLGGAA